MIPLSLFQLTLYYHIAVDTKYFWLLLLAGSLIYFALMNYFHDSEAAIAASVGGVSAALLTIGILLALKKPAFLNHAAEKPGV